MATKVFERAWMHWWLLLSISTSVASTHIKLRGDCLCHRSCIAPLWRWCWSLWLCSCRYLKRLSAWRRENLNSRIKRSRWMSLTYCNHWTAFEFTKEFTKLLSNTECLCKVNMCINHFLHPEDKGKSHPIKAITKTTEDCFFTHSKYVCFEWFDGSTSQQSEPFLRPGISGQALTEVATSRPLPLALSNWHLITDSDGNR